MKRIKFFILIFAFVISPFIFIFVQANDTKDVPPGMEIIKIGGGSSRILAPKGLKVREEFGVIIMEDTKEYLARRFLEMEERLAKIAVKEKNLKKGAGELKRGLDKIQDGVEVVQKNIGEIKRRQESFGYLAQGFLEMGDRLAEIE